MYPEEIVIPMKEELTDNGFSELLTPQEVENALQQKGTTLVMLRGSLISLLQVSQASILMLLKL